MTERWVFTEDELKDPSGCKRDDEFLATGPGLTECGVLVTRDGKATNRYGDGTRGVPKEEQKEAEVEETLYSTDPDKDTECADTWRDVETNDAGEFVRFVDEPA